MAESATFHYEIEHNDTTDATRIRSCLSGKLWLRLKRIHLERIRSLSMHSLDSLNKKKLMNSHQSEESFEESLGDVFLLHYSGPFDLLWKHLKKTCNISTSVVQIVRTAYVCTNSPLSDFTVHMGTLL